MKKNTDAQRFKWIEENNASIIREQEQKWTRTDGSTYIGKWKVLAHGCEFIPKGTLREAVDEARNHKKVG